MARSRLARRGRITVHGSSVRGGPFVNVVRNRQQLTLVDTSGECVVLSLEAEHDGFEISDSAAEPLIVVEEASVASDVPKESLGHG